MLPTLSEQQAAATARLAPEVVRYYAGGAGAEVSLGLAESAWSAVRLRPRVLRDVSDVDTCVELLGSRLAMPVLAAPTAAHALAHPDAERATAAGVAAAGSLLVLSCRSSLPPVEVAPPGPWWHQAYVFTDRDLSWRQAAAAVEAGASAIVLTGDVPWLGQRAGATRLQLGQRDNGVQDPSADLSVVGELGRRTGLPVLVKGVLRGDDALGCIAAGAAGVVVSNHGGRQLDRAVSTVRALPEIVEAVRDTGALVLVDGGLRSGLDVLCALALGADAVLLGRPVLWALAAEGAAGVTRCLEAVRSDLVHCLGLAGAARLDDLVLAGELAG